MYFICRVKAILILLYQQYEIIWAKPIFGLFDLCFKSFRFYSKKSGDIHFYF